ncbi:barstar family protein [Dactylosporangium sp. NPDC049140]|uniref:barstar family protein n=1 Tax=Dactylosporangium sp. NPDC049140 TaxID=3155647 RepID=UPI0033E0F585
MAEARWRLLSRDEEESEPAACAAVDGLFAGPPPAPPLERYTLLGVVPAGPLASAAPGAWLGNVYVEDATEDPTNAPLLVDLTVLAVLPSTLAPGLLDVDLQGRLHPDDRAVADRRPGPGGFRLTGGVAAEARLGRCIDVGGVFRERPAAPPADVVLRGCRPGPALATAVRAHAEGRFRDAGFQAGVYSDGPRGLADTRARLDGRVARAEPAGAGRFDITLVDALAEPLHAGAEAIWQRWQSGGPAGPNEWAGLDRDLRDAWCLAAMGHHAHRGPDRGPGTTVHLDGRHVTDVEGFYCAAGEAVNGPGGYFGANLDALDDCLSGGFGVAAPFRLVWRDADVARAHLTPGYDRRRWADGVTLDGLVQLFAEHEVAVELR